ncbi:MULTISPECIES: WG repeat-containing protein [Cyanophyceae]|uniref:WG repeat-containing protein n=1 Tax=Cyanophyceae TaxID=3028117 RepID=UPI0016872CC7|nr:WG repeat-containing protein [Trichocoleus sp. FACHB-69]MBD1934453.1 WG repeat-containing protein [Trichocoleus sp. FACHB-69]
MLYPVVKDLKYGFINSDGELIVEPIYDLVGRFSEDRCIVEISTDIESSIQKYINSDGQEIISPTRLQGYINSSGQEIIPLRHTPFCSSFSEGLAQYADISEKVGFIDQAGEFKISPQFNIDYEGEVSLGFSEGVAAVATEEGWTYINKEGEELFDVRFETAKRFQEGYALVSQLLKASQTESFFFIDKNGQRLETVPCKINANTHGFRNGLCPVILPTEVHEAEDNRIGFIKTNGDLAFEERFAYSSGFHEGLCIVKKTGSNFGVINTKGEWVIEPLYEEIGSFNYGIAPFRQNKKWGLLTSQGEVILSPEFLFIDSFVGYLPPPDHYHNHEIRKLTTAMIAGQGKKRKGAKQVYINRAGEIVSPFDISPS